MRYYERIVEDKINSKLTDESIINLVGPRECGISQIGTRFVDKVIKLKVDTDTYGALTELSPESIFKGCEHVMFEDIEKIPFLKDRINNHLKKNPGCGKFFTTRSRNQKNYVEVHPLSLYETGDSVGGVKLLDLFKNPDTEIDGVQSTTDFKELIDATIRGGFPNAALGIEKPSDYVERVLKKYMIVLDGTRRDYLKAKTILKTYANHIFTSQKNSRLLQMVQNECPTLAKSTYYQYINCLKELRIIQEIPAWNVKIKSPSAVRSVPKKAFCDPSIATSILELNHDDLLHNIPRFFQMFKNLCIRDLKVYSSMMDGKISYYADRYGGEIDCVLEISNGDYALINFNVSNHGIDKPIKQLLKINKIITRKVDNGELNIRKPKFLAIITATQFSYTHKSGIKMIPITVLG